MFTKEETTITVTTNRRNRETFTRPINLDRENDRQLIINYRRMGYKVVVNRHLS